MAKKYVYSCIDRANITGTVDAVEENTPFITDKFVNPNNYAGGPYFLGCFFDGNQWVAYENDERGKHEDLIRTIYEEEAFQYLYEYMIGK